MAASKLTGAGFGDRARGLLRDVVMQATVEIVRTEGWARTRMADIAALAGISKPLSLIHISEPTRPY